MEIWDSWQACAVGSAIFAALTALFGKLGVSGINSNFATFIRTVLILGLTGSIVAFNGQWESLGQIPKRGLVFLGFSAVATGLSWLFYYRALQLGPVSRVAPIDKLSVLLAMAFGIVFLHEVLSARTLTGGFLIGAGVYLLALK
jgi:transporter family protein